MANAYESGSQSRIKVRGTRDGLVIHLPEAPSPLDLIQDIQDEIERAGNFFRQGELVVNYGVRPPDQDEIGALLVLLSERGVRLRTVTAGSPEFRDLLRQWGFDQPRARRGEEAEPHADQFPGPERGAFHIHESLQAGVAVEHDQSVVVHGDVDVEATVTSNGNVIIWGALRGIAHAGAGGDHSAIVCALRLVPRELRIGSYHVLAPEEPGDMLQAPMMAKVVDRDIVAVQWRSGR